MSCGCKKNKNTTNINQQGQLAISTVHTRRDSCRSCVFATKNPHARYKSTNGLTTSSVCKKVNKLVNSITRDPLFACPLKKFNAVTK